VKTLRVTVCRGPECGPHAAAILGALRAHIALRGLESRVVLDQKTCFGRCRSGPNLVISEDRPGPRRFALASVPAAGRSAMYNHMTPAEAVMVLESHAIELLG
jgi:(2Fe-2S) ferredoxin